MGCLLLCASKRLFVRGERRILAPQSHRRSGGRIYCHTHTHTHTHTHKHTEKNTHILIHHPHRRLQQREPVGVPFLRLQSYHHHIRDTIFETKMIIKLYHLHIPHSTHIAGCRSSVKLYWCALVRLQPYHHHTSHTIIPATYSLVFRG
jgi:hypothetical protein